MWIANGNKLIKVGKIVLIGDQIHFCGGGEEWTVGFNSAEEAEKFFKEIMKKLKAVSIFDLEKTELVGKDD